MSREAMEAVQDHSRVRESTGLAVFLAIARFVGQHGEPAYPSYRTLADVAHCDKDTVARWVRVLEELGELSVRKEGRGRGTRIYYKVNLPFDQPKHGAAGVRDNSQTLSQPGRDNSAGTLSPRPGLLSPRPGLLSPSDACIVPTRLGQKPETSLKPERETRARADGQSELLSDFGVPAPATAGEAAFLEHPATLLWLKVTRRWPGYAVLPGIAEWLGEAPDEAALRRAWQLWVLSGYRADNVLGVLDWYDELRADPGWEPGRGFRQYVRELASNGRPASEIVLNPDGSY